VAHSRCPTSAPSVCVLCAAKLVVLCERRNRPMFNLFDPSLTDIDVDKNPELLKLIEVILRGASGGMRHKTVP